MNRTMRKIGKKTIGKAVDNVNDYVDILSQLVSEYFNQRYKIKKKVSDIRLMIIKSLYLLKKEFIKMLVEALFLVTGLLALVLGVILVLAWYIPLEIILVVYGLVVTIFVLMKIKLDV